ncbi:hypothetical protein JRQ81_016886, partial [Phrynocephalus forsythii]
APAPPKPDPIPVQQAPATTKKNPPKRPPRKHVVYTNTEFYHPPTHSNNSKKRLIEDTEDWHPRTGNNPVTFLPHPCPDHWYRTHERA